MTCAEAIAEVFTEDVGILTTREIIDRIYALYPERPWQENTIRQHVVGLCVNQPSGRRRPSLRRRAFLYWLGSRRYRRWVPEQDGPKPIVVAPDGATSDVATPAVGTSDVTTTGLTTPGAVASDPATPGAALPGLAGRSRL